MFHPFVSNLCDLPTPWFFIQKPTQSSPGIPPRVPTGPVKIPSWSI
jgi:hypothetical protein